MLAADGFTYERAAIQQWLEGHDTSPMASLECCSIGHEPVTCVTNSPPASLLLHETMPARLMHGIMQHAQSNIVRPGHLGPALTLLSVLIDRPTPPCRTSTCCPTTPRAAPSMSCGKPASWMVRRWRRPEEPPGYQTVYRRCYYVYALLDVSSPCRGPRTHTSPAVQSCKSPTSAAAPIVMISGLAPMAGGQLGVCLHALLQ